MNTPKVTFPAVGQAQIPRLATLAAEIWSEHYTPIIGAAQVAYMLEKFQSASAIAEQIATQNYHYFFIRHNAAEAGYIGVQQQGEVLFLSKLYVRKSWRGVGLGKRAVAFILEFARQNRATRIRLTVNRHNRVAIVAYAKFGFVRRGELVTDIGGGYVMDDYVYELRLR